LFLARVTGQVVASVKDKTLQGQKLLIVEPLNVKYDDAGPAGAAGAPAEPTPASLGATGRAIVAIDVVGCGEGQLVLVCQGSSARMTEYTKNLPADAVIVGIVDSASYRGKTFFQDGAQARK
jgi:ethanolamine utilization protein EutN